MVKEFDLKLKDLAPDGLPLYLTVAYDEDGITCLCDENDEFHELSELSSYDQDLVKKHLILQLSADLNERLEARKSEPEYWRE